MAKEKNTHTKKNATIEISRTAAGAALSQGQLLFVWYWIQITPVQVHQLLAAANNCFTVGDVVLHGDTKLGVV